jgi:hypothetical protein
MTGRRAARRVWVVLGLASLLPLLGLAVSRSSRDAGDRALFDRLGETAWTARLDLELVSPDAGGEEHKPGPYAGRVFRPDDEVDRAMARCPPDWPSAAGRAIRPEPLPERPREASGSPGRC